MELRLAVERREAEAAWDAAVQVCTVHAAELEEQRELGLEEAESEKSAEREGNEIAETRQDEGDTHVEPQHEHRRIEDGKDGIFECETLEFGELKYEPTPAPANQTMPDVTPREPQRFDWATDIDTSIGPVPSMSDFRPTTPSQPDSPKLPSPSSCPQPAPIPCARPRFESTRSRDRVEAARTA